MLFIKHKDRDKSMSTLQLSTINNTYRRKRMNFVFGKRNKENNTPINYKGDLLTTQMFGGLENMGTE